MQLAYREQPASEEMIVVTGRLMLTTMILTIVFGSLLLVLLNSIISVSLTLSCSAVLVAFLLFRSLHRQTFSPLRVLLAIVLPPLGVLVLHALAALIYYRYVGAVVFGMMAITLAGILLPELFQFFAGWIRTHPRLRTDSTPLPDIASSARMAGVALRFLVLTAVIGTATHFNGALGVITAVAVCALVANGIPTGGSSSKPNPGLLSSFQYAERMLSHVLLYGLNPSGAAGVWYPETTPNRRMVMLLSLLVPVSLMLTSLTSGFSIWEAPIVRDEMAKVLRESMKNESTAGLIKSLTPSIDWDWLDSPQVSPGMQTLFKGDPDAIERIIQQKMEVFAKDVLNASSAVPVVVTAYGIMNGNLWMLWLPLLSVVLALSVTVLFVLACARPLLKACLEFETEIVEQTSQDKRPIWQCFVDRTRASTHQHKTGSGELLLESDHLFFRVSAVADFPVLMHRPLLHEHCYIVGQTGSGKTSLAIMPLLIQIIRGSAPAPLLPSSFAADDDRNATEPTPSTETDSPNEKQIRIDTAKSPPSDAVSDDFAPVVIIDLKGDPALFHTIRAEAKARGQEFRFFTPERSLATHVFNPFSNFSGQNRSLLQVCQLILDALGLNHGEGYGRSYFTRQNREALFDALNLDPPPKTFRELNDVLKSFRGRPNYPDIFELVSTIHALTQYPQLETIEPVSDPETSIHMPTVLERRQVVYFWLPAAIESITVREIGKLALFSLLSASIDRQRNGLDTRQTYLFIDEFQRLSGENFRIVLEQARSYGLSCIMANQTQADLKQPDLDLRPTVRTNTRVKMHFGVTDLDEIIELTLLSGKEMALTQGWAEAVSSKGVRRSTESWSESLKDRFLASDILGVTDHPRRCILHVNRGSGYTQFAGLPTIVDCYHPISRELYVERTNTRWPEVESAPGTATSDVDVSEVERQRDRVQVAEQEETLSSLFEMADSKFGPSIQK